MLKDFPFTTYDFYAYLASGLVFLFCLDLILTGGLIFSRTDWSFVNGAVLIASAYIVGQIIAIPASAILEGLLLNIVFYKPIQLLMSVRKPRWREKCLAAVAGRYYRPLPESMRTKVLEKASAITGKSNQQLMDSVEAIFQPAYAHARTLEDTRIRIDDFRNQYGFARNISFTCLILLIIGWACSGISTFFVVLLSCAAVGMFIRFLKFYSSFSAEILRSFAYNEKP